MDINDTRGRVERLERSVRRLYLALGVVGGAFAITLLGGASSIAGEPTGPMQLLGNTVTGIAIEDDVAYRIRADGSVEQIAIGERREALEQLQIADPRRRIPGLNWDQFRR